MDVVDQKFWNFLRFTIEILLVLKTWNFKFTYVKNRIYEICKNSLESRGKTGTSLKLHL